MGGKGQRRREKNYQAAHGSYSRLPPPPDSSKLDVLPSKLRKLLSFTSLSQDSEKAPKDVQGKKKTGDGAIKTISSAKNKDSSEVIGNKEKRKNEHLMTPQHTGNSDGTGKNSKNEKKKRKRKRNQVDDLRFETLIDKAGTGSKRRERKKKHLEARKSKHKKAKIEDDLDFPGHEKIEFGDVVQAPPKLVAMPKAMKNKQDAFKERIRLQAIEAYRERKGWDSRPGVHLPPSTSQINS